MPLFLGVPQNWTGQALRTSLLAERARGRFKPRTSLGRESPPRRRRGPRPGAGGEGVGGALAREFTPLSPRGVPDWLKAVASGPKAVLEGARLPARGAVVAFVGPNGGSTASHAVAWRCSRFGLWSQDVARIQDGVRVRAASFNAAGARSQDRP